jgi:hypothetical protein
MVVRKNCSGQQSEGVVGMQGWAPTSTKANFSSLV